MKQSKSKKAISNNPIEGQKPLSTEQKEQEKQLILQLADEKASATFIKYKERENEKIQLLGGAEISLAEIWELRKFVAETKAEYSPKFGSEYYSEIFRLNNWPLPEGKISHKPHAVAKYTNEFIYGRFPKEILPELQKINPYIAFCIRKDKHFQWLTEEGRIQLEGFINDAVRFMRTSTTWHEFKSKYTKEFGLPFQLSIFDKNEY